MKPTHIISIILLAASIIVGYLLYNGLYEASTIEEKVAAQETGVKNKMLQLKLAQEAYSIEYGKFAENFDQLLAFVKDSSIYLKQRNETIYDVGYDINGVHIKIDSTVITYDTLGHVSVKDSLFTNFTIHEIDSLKFPPKIGLENESLKEFSMKVSNGEKGIFLLIQDPSPIDYFKQVGEKDTLRLGSLEKASLKGNWDK